MKLLAPIVAETEALVALRRDLHQYPEPAFEEVRTATVVAEKLASWGVEVHTGVGKTGVVGIVRGDRPGPTIGLRADMDALPMEEKSDVPYRSRHADAFHGCGHDGHTTMLLGAAQYLAGSRRFPGSVALIFQPGEEGGAGARAMIEDGLFRRFPCDEIYALHNSPDTPFGQVLTRSGLAMAAYDSFDVELVGQGAHGAQPHKARDPIVAVAALAQALQTVVSRNVDPLKAAVVSITKIHAGSAYNVLPESAHLGGTIRTFEPEVRALVGERVRAVAAGIAAAFDVRAEVTVTPRFQTLQNTASLVEPVLDVAREVVGSPLVALDEEPKLGSEDFADMLDRVPGVYLWVGQGPSTSLHNPRYVFNDELIPIGATLLARIAETRAAALAARRMER
jgi:hippurate hydrolase